MVQGVDIAAHDEVLSHAGEISSQRCSDGDALQRNSIGEDVERLRKRAWITQVFPLIFHAAQVSEFRHVPPKPQATLQRLDNPTTPACTSIPHHRRAGTAARTADWLMLAGLRADIEVT